MVSHLLSAKYAIKLIRIIANPPTNNPVNGDCKACSIPPSPASESAHRAVNLDIILEFRCTPSKLKHLKLFKQHVLNQ